eukprot:4763417-Amphidinium_carterae.2
MYTKLPCVIQFVKRRTSDVLDLTLIVPSLTKSNLFVYSAFPSWYAIRLGFVAWDVVAPFVRVPRTKGLYENKL